MNLLVKYLWSRPGRLIPVLRGEARRRHTSDSTRKSAPGFRAAAMKRTGRPGTFSLRTVQA